MQAILADLIGPIAYSLVFCKMEKVKVLFVCLGNICRSPMAEGLFLDLIEKEGVADRFEVDSAGTAGHHVGEQADRRMQETARSHGVYLPSRARKFIREDLDAFDYILPMDHSNLSNIKRLTDSNKEHRAQVILMRDFDPEPGDGNVPDPYYGGISGFEDVYQILLRSNQRLLDKIKAENTL